MDMSTPLRGIAAAGAQVIGRISKEMELERSTVEAGEDAPEGPSTSDLDDILNRDQTTAESQDRLKQENQRLREPAGDEARSASRFIFPIDDESVEYPGSGSTFPPILTSRYDGVDRRRQKKRPKGCGLSDVLGHKMKVQVR